MFGQTLQFSHYSFVNELISGPEAAPKFLEHVKVSSEVFSDGAPERGKEGLQRSCRFMQPFSDIFQRDDGFFLLSVVQYK